MADLFFVVLDDQRCTKKYLVKKEVKKMKEFILKRILLVGVVSPEMPTAYIEETIE